MGFEGRYSVLLGIKLRCWTDKSETRPLRTVPVLASLYSSIHISFVNIARHEGVVNHPRNRKNALERANQKPAYIRGSPNKQLLADLETSSDWLLSLLVETWELVLLWEIKNSAKTDEKRPRYIKKGVFFCFCFLKDKFTCFLCSFRKRRKLFLQKRGGNVLP